MYEDMTFEKLLKKKLDMVSNKFDKRQGSIIYDAMAPNSAEMAQAYIDLDVVAGKLDVENLDLEELKRHAYQRTGIKQKQATRAIRKGVFSKADGSFFNVEIGERFTGGDLHFKVIEKITDGEFKLECEEPGEIGNVYVGSLIPVDYVDGLAKADMTDILMYGYEAESKGSLLERYYEHIRTPATSGNNYHYCNWAKEVPGVGDARVIPQWRENETVATVKGILDSILQKQSYTNEEVLNIIDIAMRYALSVKTVIIDSNKQPATEDLVSKVQEHIDPGITGLGEGEAPIGAFCTVASATGKAINITVTITRDMNYTVEQIKTNTENNVKEYLKKIAFKKNLVSYARIGSIILDMEGVLDYTGLKVNEGIENITIGKEEVAILGQVVINE